ncbi:aminoacyl tRNA synthase complex-interacting multifunctional protein 1 isoform X2 [Selaginella moellendorffii]|uniref:aminoacyl tRNA synthase complex-interacting multifunctional protein 1 isoform X2 n=1 Tax=Selaginella moellendorffii TaxID=88036 RepID=UPI000D1C5FE2|nr:aminoacyl tRNA synthase complex-interacting multifunctional protein 1 isoform X2 [Selaginella moellendorffii]|eukprot:XP_024525230.1 aminoacyl tRNA synthase complex-interacting multifunctional protein 1 isoform X2 [Selaginella moellendorffii]
MGVPRSDGDGARTLQLLRARMGGQSVDAKEVGFVCNADVSYSEEEQPQALEWLAFAEKFFLENASADTNLKLLNTFLQSKSVFVGNGTRITLADLGMFVAIREKVAAIPVEDQENLPNLFRWFDYVQNKEDVRQVYAQIYIKKPYFSPPNLSDQDSSKASKPNVDGKSMAETDNRNAPSPQPLPSPAPPLPAPTPAPDSSVSTVSSVSKSKPAKETKEKPPAQKKEVDCDVSVLDICVGQIKKVWKHPSADTLYVEEIDVGEAQPRQIVSGLVKYVPESEMLNRRVLVLLNVKAGKVRDVLSSGLVLCASNGDHSQCEPVSPPDGVPVGERVKFAGHDGKAEEVLNPKKKQWDKIAPELGTDEQGIANYQGVPFQTSKGPCKSAIVNGSIK